ncbi:hypothetical protein LSTR_LSTR004761 [Laodelphax striatellus]|uniref:Uncharacterized protein n=1 Tax=Laodelphax striatellus TaxID=195883 RepID=A0A482XL79_LAOST|nr:hypothetical protein LSTR_LSTR004761 [Laodelphax striatellus]
MDWKRRVPKQTPAERRPQSELKTIDIRARAEQQALASTEQESEAGKFSRTREEYDSSFAFPSATAHLTTVDSAFAEEMNSHLFLLKTKKNNSALTVSSFCSILLSQTSRGHATYFCLEKAARAGVGGRWEGSNVLSGYAALVIQILPRFLRAPACSEAANYKLGPTGTLDMSAPAATAALHMNTELCSTPNAEPEMPLAHERPLQSFCLIASPEEASTNRCHEPASVSAHYMSINE